ncbi:MAG: ATP-binding cassette domain-containing protein [Acidimicrobiales bacterium]|nr:ATP-binding cassette domain-containing protein [Acidimicrobiales bacterium]
MFPSSTSPTPPTGHDAVVADGLVKRYGDEVALAGVDLAVPAGSVTALLGPNGAGKSTAVRILTTLTQPDAGRADVAGFDVGRQGHEVRRRIGLAAQDATVDHLLTGRENLVMIGELHQLSRRTAKTRAAELLDRFSLAEAGDRVAGQYSGGMRRRLDLAAALVTDPPVLFLDEPTTGLDPRARRDLWDVVDDLVDGGTTLVLTTQYLEEAERLADDIVMIDRGRVIARGDTTRLKRQVAADHVHVVLADPHEDADPDALSRAAAAVERTVGTDVVVDRESHSLVAPAPSGVTTVIEVARALDDAGIALAEISLRQPTLDDVFLTLTGRPPGAADPTNEESPDR